MDIRGERHIPASRARVWAALHDPAMLRAAIPGCTAVEPAGPDALQIEAGGARREVRQVRADPPSSFVAEWSHAAGSNASATVTLAEDGPFTLVTYALASPQVGQPEGSDAAYEQAAHAFFERLTAEVAGPQPTGADGPIGFAGSVLSPAEHPSTGHGTSTGAGFLSSIPKQPLGVPLLAWVCGSAWVVIAVMLFSAYI